jgi:hypothetical protein
MLNAHSWLQAANGIILVHDTGQAGQPAGCNEREDENRQHDNDTPAATCRALAVAAACLATAVAVMPLHAVQHDAGL